MKAVNCLKESVKKDPNYADAWVWLAARTRNLYADYPDQENNHLLKDASKYIENALRLDPKSSTGLMVKTQIEFHKKNWEQMFSSANKAFEQNSGDPNVLSNLAMNVAFGGNCTLDNVSSSNEQPKDALNNECQFHRGCWEMGLTANKMDTGNFAVMDNYMLAVCYNIVKDGKSALQMMSTINSSIFILILP